MSLPESPFRDIKETQADPAVGDVVNSQTINGVRKVSGEVFVMFQHGSAWLPWRLPTNL